ncbi:MAG: hypothetical protein ACFFB3_15170 [Candidatus Hodarchaeota archaeon]
MFRQVSPKEKKAINNALQEVCEMTAGELWPNTSMIVVHRKQNHVFIIGPQVLDLLETIWKNKDQITDLSLELACKEAGILTRSGFRIGIEVLYELAPYIRDKFTVNEAGEESFLFGNGIELKNVLNFPKNLTKGRRAIVFSQRKYPLGLVQIKGLPENGDTTKPFAINLIDYAYYLRSGG